MQVNGTSQQALTVLAVDDEAPALDELAYLLGEHPDIGEVYPRRRRHLGAA